MSYGDKCQAAGPGVEVEFNFSLVGFSDGFQKAGEFVPSPPVEPEEIHESHLLVVAVPGDHNPPPRSGLAGVIFGVDDLGDVLALAGKTPVGQFQDDFHGIFSLSALATTVKNRKKEAPEHGFSGALREVPARFRAG